MRITLAIIVVTFCLLTTVAGAAAQDTADPINCHPGTVKAEVGPDGETIYEYGEHIAEITFDGPAVTWQLREGIDGCIQSTCLKAGLNIYAAPTTCTGGTFTVPEGIDVSNIVLYVPLGDPTAVVVSDMSATPAPADYRPLVVAIVIAWLLGMSYALHGARKAGGMR